MSDSHYCVCLTTVPDEDTAEKITRVLLEGKLAACINRIGPIRSTYRWKGALEDSREYILVIKTSRDKYDSLAEAVKNSHPHTVPEIISLPIVAGYGPYLDWIGDSVC